MGTFSLSMQTHLVRIKESSVAVLFLLKTFCECKSFDFFGLLFNKQTPVVEFLCSEKSRMVNYGVLKIIYYS